MKKIKLHAMTINQLVSQFVEIGVAQDEALLENAIAKFNRLFDQLVVTENELKSRQGDQRRALLALYKHPNIQVRLNAVKATLAVAPQEARDMLQKIADSKYFPQAGDAGMAILTLEQGIYKPT
jgi:Domain of unknown function (DUF2019)